MIGSICLWNFSEDRKTAEVGYDLSPTFQKQGMMDESMKKVLNFGIEEEGFVRFEAHTHYQNIGSIKLLERNGFTFLSRSQDPEFAHNAIYELKV